MFRRHAAQLHAACTTPGQGSVALDGKTLRGSFDKFHDRAAAQIFSAFATDTALVLAHVDIAEKSNEIPAAQALLAEFGIAPGTIVTLDALHCQKKLFEQAVEAKVTLIVQVKDNQHTLLQRCQDIAAARPPLTVDRTDTKGRNRCEARTVSVFNPAADLAATPWRPHVTAVIQVEHEVFTRNAATGMLRRTNETAFYISNAPVGAGRAAQAIRGHWSIENTSHYTRDVTLGGVAQGSSRDSGWNSNGGEDRSRIRTKPGVFARLRSFGFNINKTNRTGTLSQDRYRAALAGVESLLHLTGVA